MKGLTSPLWPIRYKPLPDELLSSWLVRLAHGHGLKVQTFCNIIFGNRLQVWNRDIDRLGPDWLVNELSSRTGTPPEIAYGTTLRVYEGLLYPKFRLSGSLQWIQTLKMYHRKWEGFGLQFCPMCLRTGPEPYFRKTWRVTLNTICATHQCMMRDRCPECGAGVAFHRRDMGLNKSSICDSLAACHQCGFDLSRSALQPIVSYDRMASDWHAQWCRQLSSSGDSAMTSIGMDTMSVMRQLGMLLTSRYSTVKLRAHVCSELGIPELALTNARISMETRPLQERHHLLQLLSWLMVDLEPRLRTAWRAKAIRYNQLGKDYSDAPEWFRKVVDGFSDWRRGVATE